MSNPGWNKQQLVPVLLISAAIFAGGCTNNSVRRSLSSTNTNNGNPLGNLIPSGSSSSIALTQVVKDTLNPGSTFDLIGDGSGAFGANCTTKAPGTGNNGASTCNCSYSYTTASGSTQNFEAPTTYHESNLLRCLYTAIPSAVSTVQVRVHVTTNDSYSTPITVNFSNNGITLDTSSPLTFVNTSRYQCRDSVTVMNLFDGGVYDPFQSEDPRNTYPLNFYTTNMGGTMAIYAGGLAGAQPALGWNCPSIPNDPSYGMDLNIFSVSADSGGSKRIYPPTGSIFDRSTFYLARQKTGVFSIPVDAYISPFTYTTPPDAQGNQTGAAPIGWGAAPIPTGISGQESCPDSSVAIPTGYHWVKLWLFRMALPSRNYVTSTTLTQLGNIHCNPGEWTSSTSLNAANSGGYYQYRSIIPDCYNKQTTAPASTTTRGNNSIYMIDLPPVIAGYTTGAAAGSMISRAFEGINASILKCGNLEPTAAAQFGAPLGAGATGTYGGLNPALGQGQGPGRALASFQALHPGQTFNMASGTDQYQLNGADPLVACPAGNDPAHMCKYGFPYDSAPTLGMIDNPSSTRFDYLFVVSPPSVMSGDMANPSSPVAQVYTPYRFKNKGDCNSADPDAPATAGDCNPANALRNYGIKFHDVGTAGDPPATDPNRAGVFPVCALQPN